MKINNKINKFIGYVLTFCMVTALFSGVTVAKAAVSENLVLNPGFESGNEHWTFSATPIESASIADNNDAHSGAKSIKYWYGSGFNFTAMQTITNIENGEYTLSAITQGGGGEKNVKIFASGYGGDELSATFVNEGWQKWKKPTISSINVTNNKITIGVYVDGNAENWGTIDDFELKKVVKKTIRPVTIFTNVAEVPELPAKVTVTNSDGTSEEAAVAWDAIEPSKLASEGSFDVLGTIAGTDVKALAKVVVIEPINIPAIENLPNDFIKGMDISMLKQVEANGGKFYENGVEKDPLLIFKEHGVNWVRLRIWNNPAGKGGGENDLATTVELAKRAKALGLKLLLDFHYSDFWTDPGQQNKPEEWKDLTGVNLENVVYSYTKDVMTELKSENVLPDMVQVGNELNSGMLWPDGKNWGDNVGGFDGLAKLLKSGVKGVKDTLQQGENVKIMIHLADGGKNETFRWFFDAITERGVEFDIIGLSFYPYWHGTPEELQANANDISKRYNKEVAIAETAYAYTLEAGDNHGNIFGLDEEEEGGYPATLQGQATVVRTMMDAMAKVPDGKGLGIFYWEGAWIPVSGAGWKAGEGNAWENQAFFDYEGNTLPSLDVFKAVSSDKSITPIIIQMDKVSLKVEVGTNPTNLLPSTIRVVYSDGKASEFKVDWEEIEASKYSSEGKFIISGDLVNSEIKASAEIEVIAKQEVNYIKNPGFEADLSDWTLDGTGANISANDKHSGSKTLHYWADADFKFTVSQTVTGLTNGLYKLSAFAQGGKGEKSSMIFAKNFGGDEITAEYVTNGWSDWKTPTIENIKVTNGTIIIGALVDGNAGNWGAIDDFKLIKTADLPVSSIQLVNVSTVAGTAPVLPAKVTVNYSDGTSEALNVTWGSIESSSYQNSGSFTVQGTVNGTDIKASAVITVNPVISVPVEVVPVIIEIEKSNLTIEVGNNPTDKLPSKVKVFYNNSTSDYLAVRWDSIEAVKYSSIGTFTVEGTVSGTDIKAIANITVKEKESQAISSSVENVSEDIIKALSVYKHVTVNASSNHIVDKSVFEAIKGTDKSVTFISNGIQWTFNGADIVNEIKNIDLTFEIAALASSGSSNRASIEKLVGNKEAVLISFAENGVLPGKATVKIKLKSDLLNGKDKNNIYVYYYNNALGKAELIAEKIKIDEEGYLQFNITHNSDYFVTDKDIKESTDKPEKDNGQQEKNNSQTGNGTNGNSDVKGNEKVEEGKDTQSGNASEGVVLPKTGTLLDNSIILSIGFALFIIGITMTVSRRKRNWQR